MIVSPSRGHRGNSIILYRIRECSEILWCNVAKWAIILVVEFDTKIATFLIGIGKKGLLKAVIKVVNQAASFPD